MTFALERTLMTRYPGLSYRVAREIVLDRRHALGMEKYDRSTPELEAACYRFIAQTFGDRPVPVTSVTIVKNAPAEQDDPTEAETEGTDNDDLVVEVVKKVEQEEPVRVVRRTDRKKSTYNTSREEDDERPLWNAQFDKPLRRWKPPSADKKNASTPVRVNSNSGISRNTMSVRINRESRSIPSDGGRPLLWD